MQRLHVPDSSTVAAGNIPVHKDAFNMVEMLSPAMTSEGVERILKKANKNSEVRYTLPTEYDIFYFLKANPDARISSFTFNDKAQLLFWTTPSNNFKVQPQLSIFTYNAQGEPYLSGSYVMTRMTYQHVIRSGHHQSMWYHLITQQGEGVILYLIEEHPE